MSRQATVVTREDRAVSVAVVARAKTNAGLRVSRTLVALDDAAARHRFFARRPGLADRQLALRLLDRSREQLRVDFHRSLILAQGAACIAEHLGEESLHALGLRAIGNAMTVGGNNQASVEHHATAIAAFERLGNHQELARTLSATVQPLLLLGRYDEARGAADRARELFVADGDQVRLS